MIYRPLVLFIALFAAAASAQPQPAGAARPNVLWIIAEDIGKDLGCYGDPDARTPNLDTLAAQGRLYTQAHSTGPVCSSSRSAFNTGVYATSFDAHNHRSHRGDGYKLPSNVTLVSDRLRAAGYFTGNIGEFPAPITWGKHSKTDWNFEPRSKPFDTDKWEELPRHQPFYAQINIQETHRVYKKAAVDPTDAAKVTLPPYLPDHPIARDDWAAYHDSIHTLDGKVGQVLDMLEKDGLAANTVVFFFGDHGRECFRGKYYAYEQGVATALLARWPGKITPGSHSDELVSLIDVAATTIWLAGLPTPADIHGQRFLGDGYTPRQYLFTAVDRIDDALDHVRTVRDDRYRYIRNYEPRRPYMQHMVYAEHTNPNVNLMRELYAAGKLNADQAKFMASSRPAEELYDLQADPWEFHNLAAAPEFKQTLGRMRSTLEKWRSDTGDKGLAPEDPAALKAILDDHAAKMKKSFGE